MKRFILQHCQKDYTRDDYREFMSLTALQHKTSCAKTAVRQNGRGQNAGAKPVAPKRLRQNVLIRRYRPTYMYLSLRNPSAMHPACRMAKAIYSIKMELL